MDNNSLDSLKNVSTHGGKRKGAGRSQGSMNKATMEMKVAKKLFTERVNKSVDKLFNAQISLATGTQMLFMIHTDSKGNRRKPEMVTDPDTISRFLDENEGVDGVMDNNYAAGSKAQDYYFITTTPPNNQAIDSLLNRSFGKAKESLDVTSDGEKIQGATIVFADRPTPDSPSTDIS